MSRRVTSVHFVHGLCPTGRRLFMWISCSAALQSCARAPCPPVTVHIIKAGRLGRAVHTPANKSPEQSLHFTLSPTVYEDPSFSLFSSVLGIVRLCDLHHLVRVKWVTAF